MTSLPRAIGPYRILRALGRGGMGVVYRAEHASTGEEVALKTVRLTPDGTPPQGLVASIRREIHALARIRHPGVARILAEGIESGIPWYAMELCTGVTLDRYAPKFVARQTANLSAVPSAASALHGAPTISDASAWWTGALTEGLDTPELPALPDADDARPGEPEAPRSHRRARPTAAGGSLPQILGLVRRLCAPLSYLHGEGIVHRDLKPDNVLVREGGMPVIVDFGLAASSHPHVSRDALDVGAAAAGTAAYMSPEQARGDLVDARADLYALGCILYQLVTGQPPFVAESSTQLLAMHGRVDAAPPSRLVDAVPAGLDALVLALLAKDPRQRLGHADDVAAALDRILDEIGDTGPRAAADLPEARPYLYRARLTGRDEALAHVDASIAQLDRDRGGLWLVSGESGAGKTRFLLEAARRAQRRGALVLSGECPPASGLDAVEVPLAGLERPLQAIADRCRELGREETERVLGPRVKVLARHARSLATLPGFELHPDPHELPPEAERARLYADLLHALRALSVSRPVALLIDDLQWADDLTLGFVEVLAAPEELAAFPLLFLGAFRSEDAPSAARHAPIIFLGRLREEAVAGIAGDMLAQDAPPELSRFLAVHSEGNPFFVAELLRGAISRRILARAPGGRWRLEGRSWDELAAPASLPEPLKEIVSRRIDDLSPSARDVLDIAAVLGRHPDAALMATLHGGDELTVFEGISELLARQVLEEDDGDLVFAHDKIREAASARVGPERRRALHRAAAEALEGKGDDAILAHHWAAAGDPERARSHHLRAARRAAASHSLREAEVHYRAFLDLSAASDPGAAAARCELAERVLAVSGRTLQAIAEAELALAGGSGETELGAIRVLAALRRTEGDPAAAAALVERGLALARDAGARREEAHLLLAQASIERERGRGDAGQELCRSALALLARHGDERDRLAPFSSLAVIHLDAGQVELAADAFRSALTIARRAGDVIAEGTILGHLANIAQQQGRMEEAARLYDEALALHRTSGDRISEGVTIGNLATMAADQGRFDDAGKLFEEAIAIHRESAHRRFEGAAIGNLAILRKEQGRLAEADALYEQALAIHRAMDDERSTGIVLGNLTQLRVLQGRWDDALDLCEQALRIQRRLGNKRLEGAFLADLADLYRDRGALPRAREAYDAAISLLSEVGDRRGEAQAKAGLAAWHRSAPTGDLGIAWELLDEAEAVLVGLGNTLELAKCLTARAQVARARGLDPASYRERARAIAGALGVAPGSPLSKAIAELDAAGA